MTSEAIFDRVKNLLVEHLSIEEELVQIDSDFIDDLNADSLDIVELLMAMEQEFGISIPDEDAEKIKTVNDAVEYIKKSI